MKVSEKSGKRKKEWQTIEMKLTHSDIATMIGSTRETVSSVMSQFRKEWLLKKGLLSYSIHIEKVNQKVNAQK
ncbi:helix-turn-helix domain-containing protein [Bacillus sp. LL01]|uniref:helix-turn-helix domain-containing protein n=1 Tax=Bacillus sp. LL01 TaxID=1665556 RepID=UPI0009E571CA|nr:helix-turn-helix domain-containing protein [Bacillus sp. LL01]